MLARKADREERRDSDVLQHVSYSTADNHVLDLNSQIGGETWGYADLTQKTGAPPAVGFALTSWADPNYQHVVYTDGDRHIQELYSPVGSEMWSYGDLTQAAAAPPIASSFTLTSWADPNYQHVVYTTDDEHLHMLFSPIGSRAWAHNDLTGATGAPPMSGESLASWADSNAQHIVYSDGGMHVQEVYFPTAAPRGEQRFTAAVTGANQARSRPVRTGTTSMWSM